jgi:hypothetical protein
MMSISIGQKGKYLYKQAGDSFTVDAQVIGLNGAHIQIEFINPKGLYQHRRWLRTPAERSRFTTDLSYEVKRRGAQAGNQNAKRKHNRLAPSFSGTVLDLIYERMAEQGKREPTPEQVKKYIIQMVYEQVKVN